MEVINLKKQLSLMIVGTLTAVFFLTLALSGGSGTTEASICSYATGPFNAECMRPHQPSGLVVWDTTDKQDLQHAQAVQPSEQKSDPVVVKSNDLQPAAKYGTVQPEQIQE